MSTGFPVGHRIPNGLQLRGAKRLGDELYRLANNPRIKYEA